VFGGQKRTLYDRIDATRLGALIYVLRVTFSDPSDYQPGAGKPQNPFGANMMAFASPEDLMKTNHSTL